MWFGSKGNTSNEEHNVGQVAPLPVDKAPTVIPQHLDAAKLHPMAKLGGNLQYLDLESNARRADGLIASRGWTEDLSYGTGAMYLLSLGVGGTYGLMEGLRKTNEHTPTKIRVNTILNCVTKRGPFLGNTAGVLTIFYNVYSGAIAYARGGVSDDAGSLAAGALTGATFRMGSGPRAMAISSALATGAAGIWCVIKRLASPSEESLR